MTRKLQNIWHQGEDQLHKALGVTEKMQLLGPKVVRDYMPDEHRDFYRKIPFVVMSALDSKGQVWALIRAQSAGFIQSSSPHQLSFTSQPLAGEPADIVFEKGAKVSILGIEFETKRRNRANGTIAEASADQMHINIDQSYGNCPRYIHVREPIATADTQSVCAVAEHNELQELDVAMIRASDMLFIGSRAAELNDQDHRAGIDINHRGGEPGFVTIIDKKTLVIPDYPGNNFFNAYGNIVLDSRASVLFLEPSTGDILTLIGHAEVIVDAPDTQERFGSNRYLKVSIDLVRRTNGAFPLRYKKVAPSTNPPPRGTG